METAALILLLAAAPPAQPACLASPAAVQEAAARGAMDDMELLTRLVFAETSSAGLRRHPRCAGRQKEAAIAIAYGVMSRVRQSRAKPALARRWGSGLRGVIFKKGQFNPAVSPRSAFAGHFSCPPRQEEWAALGAPAVAAARRALASAAPNPLISTPWEKRRGLSLVSHFYYPHSSQATPRPPDWARPEKQAAAFAGDLIIDGHTLPGSCLWFFRHVKPW